MYDIVFISYQEPNCEENWQRLVDKWIYAKRIHGVKGIHQAHIQAAKQAITPMFWVVDGDAIICDDFQFDYQVQEWDLETVHVWRSINPINGLEYGYGGVKLLPRSKTLNMNTANPDMTTSISNKFKAVDQISNITAFNTDPFNTWKSSFRECVKLASKTIKNQKNNETNARLEIWQTVGHDKPFGAYCILGAKLGMAYGLANQKNKDKLYLINDFDWLKQVYEQQDFSSIS